jgi:hypothetical protein
VRAEYIFATLVISAIVAILGLWRSAHSRSYVAWAVGMGAVSVFAATHLIGAFSQINRPPETEAEAFYRTRFEAAEIERRSSEAQLKKAQKIADQVDGALKRSSQAERERDTAQLELRHSVSETNSLRLKLENEKKRRERADERIARTEAEKSELEKSIQGLEDNLRKQLSALDAERVSKEQAEVAVAHSLVRLNVSQARRRRAEAQSVNYEKKLKSVARKLASLRKQRNLLMTQAEANASHADQGGHALFRQLQAKIETENYIVEPRPEISFFPERNGTYYRIILREWGGKKEFEFTNVEPPLISDEPEFLKAAAAFLKEIVLTLEVSTDLELYVRGSADTRQIRSQPDSAKLEPFRTYYSRARVGRDRYEGSGVARLRHIALPLKNEDLPNLRAAYLAARLNSQSEASGVRARFSVLDQEPDVAFREGEEEKLRPELFLFMPKR